MNVRYTSIIIVLIVFLFFTISCNQQTVTPQPIGQTTNAISSYPSPEIINQTYPQPSYPILDETPINRSPIQIPTPTSDKGVIYGQLYDANLNEPLYDGVIIYLSRVVPTDNEEMDAVSFDKSTDPFIDPDIEGGFAFSDVPPGRYGIVVQAPLNQYLTRYANDQTKDVIITVEAGQSVDVGRILAGFP